MRMTTPGRQRIAVGFENIPMVEVGPEAPSSFQHWPVRVADFNSHAA
jgi:hypothetical protein